MQDLFLKLGLDPEATSAQILEAIEAKPGQSAAAEILLNDHRRAAYQRTVFTLRSIGQLRHRLGLDNEASWFLETCADFAPRMQSRKYAAKTAPDSATTPSGPVAGSVPEPGVAPAATAPAATPPAAAQAAGTRAGAGSRPWLKPLLVLAGVALLLIVLYAVL